jgi:flagellar motor protein MotB
MPMRSSYRERTSRHGRFNVFQTIISVLAAVLLCTIVISILFKETIDEQLSIIDKQLNKYDELITLKIKTLRDTITTYQTAFKDETEAAQNWENDLTNIENAYNNKKDYENLEARVKNHTETIDKLNDELESPIWESVKDKLQTLKPLVIDGNELHFEPCKAEIINKDQSYKDTISKIKKGAKVALEEGFNVITVEGHADDRSAEGCPGCYNSNRKLSAARAEYVAEIIENYLIHDLNKKPTYDFVISTAGYGKD